MPPQRVWFSSRFGRKTGIDFDHLYYCAKSGIVLKGTTEAYQQYLSFQLVWIVEKEKYSNYILLSSSWIFGLILPILDFVTDAKLNYGTTKVWKRVWILEATVQVKFSCDTSQPSREYPSLYPLPPLNVVFRNSPSQSCEPTLRGQGGEICHNKCD